MRLFKDNLDGNFTAWKGEAIGDIRHPLDIGTKWTSEELAAVGLYAPVEADPVPDGFRIVSRSVQRVGNVVQVVNVTEAIPVKTPAQIESDVQEEVNARFGSGASDFDKAGILFDADIWKLLNPALTKAQARAAVKARYVTHLRAIKGL
jgi:hypothetical protein